MKKFHGRSVPRPSMKKISQTALYLQNTKANNGGWAITLSQGWCLVVKLTFCCCSCPGEGASKQAELAPEDSSKKKNWPQPPKDLRIPLFPARMLIDYPYQEPTGWSLTQVLHFYFVTLLGTGLHLISKWEVQINSMIQLQVSILESLLLQWESFKCGLD